MKAFFIVCITAFALNFISVNVSAQSTYKTAAGLQLDLAKGITLAGPTLKNFFNSHNALEVDALLGINYVSLGAFYQYHIGIKKTSALKFYLGVGPEIFAGPNNTNGALLRPMAGFDYKVTKLPLSITADYRPSLSLGNQSKFEASRFGIGARYAFR